MFYDLFNELCQKKGVSVTRAALDMGLSKSHPTAWKKRGLTPNGDTLNKVADYFSVSTDYLLGNGQNEKAPTQEGEREINDDDIKFALFGTREIDDDVLKQVKDFARFARENRKDK